MTQGHRQKQKETPDSQTSIDATKMSAADIAVMISSVQERISEAKKNIKNLNEAIQTEDSTFTKQRNAKLQEYQMSKLKKQLEKSIAGKINGQMAARVTLNACLAPISGGGRHSPLTLKIKRLLSHVPIPQRCLVFKGYQFPKLYPAGHSHKDNGNEFGGRIKSMVLRCLCNAARENMRDSQNAGNRGMVPTTTSFVEKEDVEPEPVVPPGASKMSPAEIESQLAKIAKEKEDVVSSMKKVSATLKKEERSFNKERAFKKEKIKLTVMKKKRYV